MKIKRIICIVPSGIAVLLHLLFFFSFGLPEQLSYHYEYPQITSLYGFWGSIIISLLIPSLLFLLCILMIRVKKQIVSYIVLALGNLFLYGGLVISFFFLWFTCSGISSYTDNPADIGNYDSFVQTKLNYWGQNILPEAEKIPENSTYEYYYSNGVVVETYRIKLYCRFENEERYQNELDRLSGLNIIWSGDACNRADSNQRFQANLQKNDNEKSISYLLLGNQ